ncbi:MAG: PP2C family protein-serine/threonine phosphatase, partial [Polyangiaceae bacterium]
RISRDDHATLTILRYDSSGEVTFAGAHEDIIIHRAAAGRCEVIETPGTWVGGRRDIRAGAVDTRLTLGRGDVMLLYTGGVTEMRNASSEQFGIDRRCVEFERVHDAVVDKIQEHLLMAVGEWGIAEDDVTVLVARYMGV